MKSRTFTRITKVLLLAVLFLLIGVRGWGQRSIISYSSSVTENFNSLNSTGTNINWLNNSNLAGIYISKNGLAPSSYSANDGDTYTNGFYAMGDVNNSDRSIGFVSQSNTYFNSIGGLMGLRLRNNTGATITTITVTWKGEQWRNMSNGAQTISLYYKTAETISSLPTTSLNGYIGPFTGTGSAFSSPYIGLTQLRLPGNEYSSIQTSTASPISLPDGWEIMLLWIDPKETSSNTSDVISIDDISVTADGYPVIPVATSPTNITSTSFTLNWEEADYATSYKITIYDDLNQSILDYTDISVEGSTSFTFSEAAPGKTYTYTVKSVRVNLASQDASNSVTTYTESNEPDYIFQGDHGSNWSDVLSWSSDVIPTVYNSAIIDANCYVNVNDATCNNLTIYSGKTLNINPGKILTVNGEISQPGGTVNSIKILSNSLALDGTGILMHGNSGAKGTIERFVSGTSNFDGELYHLVSVPINTAVTPLYSEVFLWSYLARYDESANNWYQMNTSTDNSIVSGRGYMTYDPTDASETYLFPGQFNNSTTYMTVSFAGSGWNLVGNPYPSPIDWDAANAWKKTNIDNTLYLWDAVNHNYITYINGVSSDGRNNPGIISPGQAFFVRANAASPVLSVNNLARTTSTVPLYKGALAISDLLRITANIDEKHDAIVIRLSPEATDEFDRNYDAYNLSSMAGLAVPDIYTIDANNTKYSINSLPFTSEEMIIDMVFKYGTNGIVTLKATELESFLTQHPDLGILLEDKQTGIITSLKLNPEYTFSYSTTDEPNRFRIHMGNTLGVHENVTNAVKCQVFAVKNDLVIKYEDFANQAGSASIFDLQGRLLKQIQLDQSGNQQEHINVSPGIYMVKLTFSGHSETHKIAVR